MTESQLETMRDKAIALQVARLEYAFNNLRAGRLTQTQHEAKVAEIDQRAADTLRWVEQELAHA